MDAVPEKNSCNSTRIIISSSDDERSSLMPIQVSDLNEINSGLSPMPRNNSAILSALRRPSQHLALSAAHAFMNQRRHLQNIFSDQGGDRIEANEHSASTEEILRKRNRHLGDDALTNIVSALYGKVLVVLGIAFPITEIVSNSVGPFFYQAFYLYLYVGSIAFVLFTYGTRLKKRYFKDRTDIDKTSQPLVEQHPLRYGSFYLRLGAIAFGIGSMVHSGLEFGRYFELKNNSDCYSNILQGTTPAARMLLTLVQIQFIFLNSKELGMIRHKFISRFGLMHMIATNLCEWLYVIVKETKHEILHFSDPHDKNSSLSNTNSTIYGKYCREGKIMGSLVNDASTILFPCTIEYSLICAVILYEMWKQMRTTHITVSLENHRNKSQNTINKLIDEKTIATLHNMPQFSVTRTKSHHHFTIDCSKSHNGLFAGILLIVLTIISLIMFFVLSHEEKGSISQVLYYKNLAAAQAKIVESILYVVTIIVVLIAIYKLRDLNYKGQTDNGHSGQGLDSTLLVVAQSGMFIYCMFSIIGSIFTNASQYSYAGLLAEIFAFIQTCLQTLFVLDGNFRRCRNIEQAKRKPGRELITFLIIANMAMWTINSLAKNRAQFRPAHKEFYGEWTWTIITHISMPLAIFYRFHSTICLFEIWKTAYKLKKPLE